MNEVTQLSAVTGPGADSHDDPETRLRRHVEHWRHAEVADQGGPPGVIGRLSPAHLMIWAVDEIDRLREDAAPPLRQFEPTRLPDPWLEVVIPARYGGTYEGAPFVAFYVDPDCEWVPEDAVGPDPAASAWWDSSAADLAGRGASPNEALADLKRRRPEVDPPHDHAPEPDTSGHDGRHLRRE